MAHIEYRPDKPKPYRAHINRKGHGHFTKSFLKERDAELWGDEQERSLTLTGLPLPIEQLKKVFVRDIVSRYLKEITPKKGCRVSESSVLNKFLREQPGKTIADKYLAYVSREDVYKYIIAREKEVKTSSIRRELNSIQHVFAIAREYWGYSNLGNPFHRPRFSGKTMNRRKRRLEGDELQRLEQACNKCIGDNKYYAPLAIYLAIQTGMRLQEIFNLRWKDIDLEKRRIEVRKSKGDRKSEYNGRTIVLPLIAKMYLHMVAKKQGTDGSVFPMTKEAFKQAWVHVKKNAGITNAETEEEDLDGEEGLTFHDLRREAGSWFDDAQLTKTEHELMMGHKSRDMTSLYISSTLKLIQAKLDKHFEETDESQEGLRLFSEWNSEPANG